MYIRKQSNIERGYRIVVKSKSNSILTASKGKIRKIASLLEKADNLFKTLPLEIQEAILEYHTEDTNLMHVLRWGEQNSKEIHNEWRIVISDVDKTRIA